MLNCGPTVAVVARDVLAVLGTTAAPDGVGMGRR